jgi:hypothetical protein
MRFTVTIDTPPVGTTGPAAIWKAEIKCAAKSWRREMVQQPDGEGGLLPYPSAAPLEGALGDMSAQPPQDVLKLYKEIVARKADRIADYGRYLFDNLLGNGIWAEILEQAKLQNEQIIELALSWTPTDGNLSRLHWEMMFDGSNFLAAGHLSEGKKIIDVAVTRVVPNTTAVAAPGSGVPRVLFVIGTSLSNPSIRPGAEIMGLLQDPQADSRIHPWVIENASPRLIQAKVAEFSPDVVHFICHGDIDARTKAGYIEMKPDPGNDQKYFFAGQVWQWLNVGETPPRTVILSACQSGAALGPHAVAPLAAELVIQGVPIVIAMSGRISDLACRLFTRRFAQALLSGETLVAATARGRRAAVAEGDAPKRSVDWGFPTLYLSAAVAEDYAPGTNAVAMGQGIEKRIKPYQLRRDRQPVFCGRQDFFEAYHELLDSGSRTAVLAAYTGNNDKGYGRTRLLEELTMQAIRDGHVPCVVLANERDWVLPKTALEFALRIDNAMETARSSLGLDTDIEGPIRLLKYFDQKFSTLESLPDWLGKALKLGAAAAGAGEVVVTPFAISRAIEKQFAQLMEEARRKKPDLVGKNSRAILLLDDVHDYFKVLDSIAGRGKLGVWGFGSEDEPVPIIMAFSLSTPTHDLLNPITESGTPGWRSIKLGPFDSDPERPEDMLAYGRVLMNPFNPKILPQWSDRAWFMDYEIEKSIVTASEATFRTLLNGLPGQLSDKLLYASAMNVARDAFVKLALDEQKLKELIEENT